jgi:hypothetical protein
MLTAMWGTVDDLDQFLTRCEGLQQGNLERTSVVIAHARFTRRKLGQRKKRKGEEGKGDEGRLR